MRRGDHAMTQTVLGEAPRPPSGRWRRFVPMAVTVVLLWLRWRWLRIMRWLRRSELPEQTARFHLSAARSIVRRAVRQQGLIIKSVQFLGSRADILREEYVETMSLVHGRRPATAVGGDATAHRARARRVRRRAVRGVRPQRRRRRLARAGLPRAPARRHRRGREGAVPRASTASSAGTSRRSAGWPPSGRASRA